LRWRRDDRDRDTPCEPDLSRIEAILRSNAAITTLVNNAGVGATAPLLKSDVDKMSE